MFSYAYKTFIIFGKMTIQVKKIIFTVFIFKGTTQSRLLPGSASFPSRCFARPFCIYKGTTSFIAALTY